MTTKTKGNFYELKTKKLLEAEGYLVERATAKIVWIKGRPISTSHDFFGLFDLICCKGSEVRFIQVKFIDDGAGSHVNNAIRDEIRKFPAHSKELWTWKKMDGRVALGIEVL